MYDDSAVLFNIHERYSDTSSFEIETISQINCIAYHVNFTYMSGL